MLLREHPPLAPRLSRRLGRPRRRLLSRTARAGARRARAHGGRSRADAQGTQFAPNAFVRIAPDDTVSIVCKHIEMGQGPYTGLTTIVAEELDADWSQMRAVPAPANDELYKNLAFGVMGTGGSTAIANSYDQLRAGRRHRARHAGRRSGRGMGRAARRDHRGRAGASATPHRAATAASALSPRRAASITAAESAAAQGSERLQAHRIRRASARHGREVERARRSSPSTSAFPTC